MGTGSGGLFAKYAKSVQRSIGTWNLAFEGTHRKVQAEVSSDGMNTARIDICHQNIGGEVSSYDSL